MNDNIHIGKLIQKKMDEDGRKVCWLAGKINCDESTVYRIYQQRYIHIEQLNRICLCLDFDFFIYCSKAIRTQIAARKRETKALQE
jgi:hypothetical protein